MSDLSALERFLDTDPRDGGCGEAMELLHVYAELLRRGEDAARFHPRIAAHLRACGPCKEDLEGLLLAIEDGAG
ncbi:hypothetical protein AB0F91_21105 [Amycolatopsis sp. NPDC023774]|uniref:hypothetical protein n=1 Tax=Amycolatopsis sp. NPDC023774 TaxID=3155015 RepID=UPI003401B529